MFFTFSVVFCRFLQILLQKLEDETTFYCLHIGGTAFGSNLPVRMVVNIPYYWWHISSYLRVGSPAYHLRVPCDKIESFCCVHEANT